MEKPISSNLSLVFYFPISQSWSDAHRQNLRWLPARCPSMRVTLALTAWTVSVVSSYSYAASGLPDIDNEAFIKDCVRFHNKFRSEVKPAASDMLYMVRKIPVFVASVSQNQRMCADSGKRNLDNPGCCHLCCVCVFLWWVCSVNLQSAIETNPVQQGHSRANICYFSLWSLPSLSA